MKRLLALTLVFATCATMSALAGGEQYSAKDSKAIAPVAPPPCDWTGFYIGGSMGWRGGDSKFFNDGNAATEDSPELLAKDFQSGFIIGAQAGYNRQILPWFVIGIEGTASWSTNFGPTGEKILNQPGDEVKHIRSENDFTGTLGLRLGVSLLQNKMLLYAKAGGAVTHWNYELLNDETQTAGFFEVDRYNADDYRVSPMVGGGIEYAFNCHWSAKVEWMHLFIGRDANHGTLIEAPNANGPENNDVANFSQDLDYDSVQFGLNYKF